MQIICPSCGGALRFDAALGKLKCDYCGNNYEPDSSEISHYGVENHVKLNRYICSSCGAASVVNGNQIDKKCPFCGMPSVIYDRVSEELEPDFIVPFKLTKEQALQKIMDHFNNKTNRKYMSEDVRNMKVSDITAMYIPYSLWSARVTKSFTFRELASEPYLESEASAVYVRVPFDAEQRLDDTLSAYILPFDQMKFVPFDVNYLSDVAADMPDVNANSFREEFLKRTEAFLLGQMIYDEKKRQRRDTSSAKFYARELYKGNVEIDRVSMDINGNRGASRTRDLENMNISYDDFECGKCTVESALFPVFIATILVAGKPYYILVNGENGKVVGNLPVSTDGIKASATKLVVISCIVYLLIAFGCFLPLAFGYDLSSGLIFYALPFVIALTAFIFKFREYKLMKKTAATTQTIERLKGER